jgi:hypothetical protein
MSGAARAGDVRASDAWLGRFVRVRQLRTSALFERHAVRDMEGGERLVVIATRPGARQATGRLDAAARALALVDHPHVPRVAAHGARGDVAWLALDCDAVDDLEGVWSHLASEGRKLPVQASWGLGECLLDVLRHAHARRDVCDGGPLCLGAAAWSNVLVSECGKPWLLGFGDDLGNLAGDLTVPSMRAPEVACGARPWPGGDLWALLTLFRTLLPLRELPPQVARVMRGEGLAEDGSVHARLRALHASLLAPPAERTCDAGAVREAYRALWAEVGVHADLDAFRALVAQAVRERCASARTAPHLRACPAPSGPVLVLAADGSWFRVGEGARVDLAQRHVARRLLLALVDRARDADGAPLSTFELREAGWPGERMQPEAGAHRVHVALHQLRKLGLAEQLVRAEHGYRLAGRVDVAPA